MRDFSFKAFFLGAVCILVLDVLFSILIAVELGAFKEPDGAESIMMSSPGLMRAMVYGLISTMLGGFVAGLVAKRAYYLNAGALGLGGVILGIFMAKQYPLWFNVSAFATVVPASLLGGYIAKRLAKNQSD